MVLEPQITFRHMDPSPAVEADVRRRIVWLERFHPRIMGCRVVIEAPHQHRRQGTPIHCRIDLTVPGAELVIGRDPPLHRAHADVYVAVRDAFRAARRALMDHLRMSRFDVKTHEPVPVARIARMFEEPELRYGFLQTAEGREVFFHEHAVLDGWGEIKIGDRVRFIEEQGDKGPQASTVELVGQGP